MKAKSLWINVQLFVVAIGTTAFWMFGMAVAELATPEMTIHVTMKDRAYIVTGHTSPGALTAIILRNEDNVTHGFSSPLFRQTLTIAEGDAEEIRRRGHIFSYHVDPGKTATIWFKKGRSSHPETVQVAFWCDIHAQMQSEFLVVETMSEI